MGRELQRAYGQESQVVLTMPILEGLDGVQKMSKSLGNAIGIQEPPLEMYGKIMSISDQMMWRYYELLTDVQLPEIEKMKRETHPMQTKKDLARRIVADFHSAEAATKAAEDWAKQFQKGEVPSAVEHVSVDLNKIRVSATRDLSNDESSFFPLHRFQEDSVRASDPKNWRLVRLDKLLTEAGFVQSRTEAARKIEENAVKVIGQVVPLPVMTIIVPCDLNVALGKKTKIVSIAESS